MLHFIENLKEGDTLEVLFCDDDFIIAKIKTTSEIIPHTMRDTCNIFFRTINPTLSKSLGKDYYKPYDPTEAFGDAIHQTDFIKCVTAEVMADICSIWGIVPQKKKVVEQIQKYLKTDEYLNSKLIPYETVLQVKEEIVHDFRTQCDCR